MKNSKTPKTKTILILVLVNTLFLFNGCFEIEKHYVVTKQPVLQTYEAPVKIKRELKIKYKVKDVSTK